ncbi:MAG: VCBS repeat-containing protein [Saprospiraceae bacterium]|nr:VCBS repeat-containing protein [Saprospiraceae bacterium]
MNIKLKQILICIPMILFGGLLKSQYSGIVFTGDTMILELDDTLGGNIQWQEREDTLTIWNDIAGATTNPYQFIVPSANDKIKYYRAKIVYTPSFCKSYSTEINFKIIDGNFNLKIGDYLAGGIYFYHNNEFALIAAPRDQNHTHWGCEGVEINGADSSGIGSGEENTRHIIDQCNEPGIAAHQADTLTLNGFTDWYLPSINELQLMIESLYDHGFGFISQNYYWSSTESNKNRAWGYSTLGKQILEINKNDKFRKFHPIRKLSLNQKNKLKYSFKLLPNDEIHDLKIVPVKGSLTNVLAIHTGEGKETDNYIWDFGNGNVVSGSGKGPYEINYNYGGYSKITARNNSSTCPNEIAQSDYFRVKLFEKINLELPLIYMGALDWGDYNNDGLLDILSTGSSYFEIYKNVGNDSFTKIPHLFPKISLSGCDWGDFNNDQLLDFAVCGYSDSNCITEVYENVGNDSFIKLNSNLPGVKNGFVKWFDMDNDGSLELLISGEKNDSTPLTKIFTKFGSGQAVELNSKLVELKNSAGSFGDYNKDGYTDLLISGHDGAIRKTIIYKNDFGNLIETPIEINGIENGSVDWGDYDNDGALDFAITGAQDSISIEYLDGGRSVRVSTSKAVFTGIYRQDKIDSFKYNIGFDKLNSYVMSSLDWGDYDNDGYIDLAISGVPSLQYVSVIVGGGTIGNVTFPSLPKILRNNQNHTFNNIYIDIPNFLHSNTKIENVEHDFECRSISFGDYNNDGNLDLLREGKTRFRSTIYKNETYTKIMRLQYLKTSFQDKNVLKLN